MPMKISLFFGPSPPYTSPVSVFELLRQVEGKEVKGSSFSFYAEIQGFFFAQPFGQSARKALSIGAGLHRNAADDLAVLLLSDGDGTTVSITLEIDCDLSGLPQVEIFESHSAVGAEVGYVLVGAFLPVPALLGEEGVRTLAVLERPCWPC